ncbi:hypothetical protein GCM10022225_07290 [Plantactinospora mayteni]|uniref:Uncharacterized protein n=1 Tax=Plantactinospora mayteni TaxID=566021 RepID=A0ABQ4ERB5_9ACTN|nr:hypothetical protein Pma05_37900 [Plantactinospora mayteni]
MPPPALARTTPFTWSRRTVAFREEWETAMTAASSLPVLRAARIVRAAPRRSQDAGDPAPS